MGKLNVDIDYSVACSLLSRIKSDAEAVKENIDKLIDLLDKSAVEKVNE